MYTIYVLAEPKEVITWADVRYVGMSINTAYRFQQHLSCTDASNEEKNEWVRGLLVQSILPVMRHVEEVEDEKEARNREQHWIRYAMSQGAELFNRAITYTDDERAEIHARRAIFYAKIAKVLAQGIYVKRWTGHFYPPRLLGPYAMPERPIALIDARGVFFLDRNGHPVDIEFASDEEFDFFIRQRATVAEDKSIHWTLEERTDAIEFAMYFGAQFDFCEPPPIPEKKSRGRKTEPPNIIA